MKKIEATPENPNKENFVSETLDYLFNETAFWASEHNPLRAVMKKSPGSSVFLVLGENASGKSFVVEHVRHMAKSHAENVKSISLSIRERTGSGLDSMASIKKAMIFGDESESSTGSISAKVIQRGFENLKTWIADGVTPILVLDEPEIGLSESYHGAVGALAAQMSDEISCGAEHAVILVTHSKKLVRAMLANSPTPPNVVCLGSHASLEQWLEDDTEKTVEELHALSRKNLDTKRSINAALDAITKSGEKASPNP